MWCCGLEEWRIKITLMYEGFQFKLRLLCSEYKWEGAKRIGGEKKQEDVMMLMLVNQGQQ
jgi:hypothetical protein